MPTRKTVAKKKVAAKSPAKKSASKKPSQDEVIANAFVEAIISGAMDGFLERIDDALEQRSKAANTTTTKKTTTSATKKVSPPPKRSTAAKLTLTKGDTYAVSDASKSLAGAKVKFHNYKQGSDNKKAVIEMLVDKPGNPKGKKIVIPAAALVEFKARGRAKK